MPECQEETVNRIAHIIGKECAEVCRRPKPAHMTEEKTSLFRDSRPRALNNWSYQEQKAELELKSPTFLTMIEAAAFNRANLNRNKQKTVESLLPGLMTACGILFFCRSQEMKAHATLTGMLYLNLFSRTLVNREKSNNGEMSSVGVMCILFCVLKNVNLSKIAHCSHI